MQPLWDFLENNKDAITTALALLGAIGSILGVLWGGWKLLWERSWNKKLRNEIKAFEVITDSAKVLPKLLRSERNSSLLADHNIQYQRRDSQHDTQVELKSILNKKRYLLVTAPEGYGKTREAGMLAETLVREGFRIVNVVSKWLDVPKSLPNALEGNSSRILIFLDNLSSLFRSEEDQSARAEKIPFLIEKSYHDRLLDVLDWFEKRCGEDEIRVIATARSEAAEWRILNYNEEDKLWKRFTRMELSEPKIESVVEFLNREVKNISLKGRIEDFEAIARKNDGSYRNLILNLKKSQAENSEITKENFTDTQFGSWQEQYERILLARPEILHIYDAIDIARQSQIELYTFIIGPLATIVWGGNAAQRWIRRRKIDKTLDFITDQKKFLLKNGFELVPRDGQIEAKQKNISSIPYLESLTNLLMNFDNNKSISNSLLGLARACNYQGKSEQAFQLIKRHLELNQLDADITARENFSILLDDLDLHGGNPLLK